MKLPMAVSQNLGLTLFTFSTLLAQTPRLQPKTQPSSPKTVLPPKPTPMSSLPKGDFDWKLIAKVGDVIDGHRIQTLLAPGGFHMARRYSLELNDSGQVAFVACVGSIEEENCTDTLFIADGEKVRAPPIAPGNFIFTNDGHIVDASGLTNSIVSGGVSTPDPFLAIDGKKRPISFKNPLAPSSGFVVNQKLQIAGINGYLDTVVMNDQGVIQRSFKAEHFPGKSKEDPERGRSCNELGIELNDRGDVACWCEGPQNSAINPLIDICLDGKVVAQGLPPEAINNGMNELVVKLRLNNKGQLAYQRAQNKISVVGQTASVQDNPTDFLSRQHDLQFNDSGALLSRTDKGLQLSMPPDFSKQLNVDDHYPLGIKGGSVSWALNNKNQVALIVWDAAAGPIDRYGTGKQYLLLGTPRSVEPTGCSDAIKQLATLHPSSENPTIGFVRNQTCIALFSCASVDIQNKAWLNKVVSDFVSPFMAMSGEWKTKEEECRDSSLPNVASRVICEAKMANYHISVDLQKALNQDGCGSQADWDAIQGMLIKCSLYGVIKDVGPDIRPIIIGEAVTASAIIYMRNEVRNTCIQYRTAKGLPIEANH